MKNCLVCQVQSGVISGGTSQLVAGYKWCPLRSYASTDTGWCFSNVLNGGMGFTLSRFKDGAKLGSVDDMCEGRAAI